MKLGEETLIELEPGKTIIVKLLSVSIPNEEGMRTVFFKVNGENRILEVFDKSLNIKKVENIKIDASISDQIGAPFQGSLYKVLVKKGQEVTHVLVGPEKIPMIEINAPGTPCPVESAQTSTALPFGNSSK